MALNKSRNWLITYDIADPRRLRRVYRFLLSQAVPVQYSVFVTRVSPMEVGVLKAGLAAIIDESEDDVRIYPIPEPADLTVFGKKALPDGLNVIDGHAIQPLAPFVLKDAPETNMINNALLMTE